MLRPLFLFVLFACLTPMTTDAQTAGAPPGPRPGAADPIRYTLRFPDAARHYVDVEASYPATGQTRLELMMAVWTPGSYLVREYARHVEGVEVVQPAGGAAPVKTRKNRWAIDTGGAPRVTVRYRVYSREMSVRTNWVEARFALVQGAATFLTLVDGLQRPHHVSLELPQGWARAMSGLPEGSGTPSTFVAADFDTLVDSPIVAGDLKVYEFTRSGKPHYLVNVNEGGTWDGARAIGDVERIVAEHERMWGSLPYDKYVFINMITEAGGGLEHKNSTVLMTSRWAMGTRPSYLAWLNLVSHEFFHVWNVKRLRPVALGPFDYENETYSPSLWMSEGFTSYYGDLLARRAGLASDAEYFGNLSGDIRALETTPGRLVQPVTQSSYDAWIKQYRPDENSPNTTISYYTKGLVIAVLLDARIRLATGNQKSLDDVMRLAYQRYSGARGFTEAQFRAVVTEVGGAELTDVLARALDTTQPLEYQPLLDAYGLQFAPADSLATRGWLGITTRVDAGRLLVNQVRRDTPAAAAGLNVDDEIIAIGDYRVRADQWERRLEQYPPTTAATLLVARRDQLMKIEVTFGQEPGNAWRLAPRVAPTAAQTATRTAWLGGTP
ncbi:M61 family metallopeptidase [Luteitalea sp.]|uniref:M61 family metallopeptidase n=1 Tax=Luteitalea sp. TaxID=2004800 RepID=UPI000A89F031|nr:PDZ domain-containing protein [Luteitalea sp.]